MSLTSFFTWELLGYQVMARILFEIRCGKIDLELLRQASLSARSFHFSSLFNDDSAHRRPWLNSASMPARKARKKDKTACCYFFVIALKINRTTPSRIVSGVTRIKKTSALLTRPGMQTGLPFMAAA